MNLKMFFALLIFASSAQNTRAEQCANAQTLHKAAAQIGECIEPECLPLADKSAYAGKPEEKLKQQMQNLSDDEIYTRLIFSESLAANCGGKLSKESVDVVTQGIASVIRNRLAAKNEKKYGLDAQVVFKPYQFRSTTGSCDVAKRKEFLCPSQAGQENWKALWQSASQAWQKIKKQGSTIGDAKMYFLSEHFNESKDCAQFKGKQPAWVDPKKLVTATKPAEAKAYQCVQFYKD